MLPADASDSDDGGSADDTGSKALSAPLSPDKCTRDATNKMDVEEDNVRSRVPTLPTQIT